MLDVEWSFYADAYCGDMSEREFKRYITAAATFVEQITQGRELPEVAGRRAICAVADVMCREGKRANIVSENNDGLAVTYADTSSAGVMRECYRAAVLYLGGTGLMYRGVGAPGGVANAGGK